MVKIDESVVQIIEHVDTWDIKVNLLKVYLFFKTLLLNLKITIPSIDLIFPLKLIIISIQYYSFPNNRLNPFDIPILTNLHTI